MDTICILIGNSDNKLTQNEWAHFVEHMKQTLERIVYRVHFFGGSETYAPWQNCCWVCQIAPHRIDELKADVSRCRGMFQQESVAVLVGETAFI